MVQTARLTVNQEVGDSSPPKGTLEERPGDLLAKKSAIENSREHSFYYEAHGFTMHWSRLNSNGIRAGRILQS